jgi:hypothetical protein
MKTEERLLFNSKVGETITKIVDFTKLHAIDAKFHIFTVQQLRKSSDEQNANWATFENDPGVYCLFSSKENEVLYSGMSLKNTGSRVFNQVFMNDKQYSDSDLVLIVSFKEQFWYISPSLESYLIHHLQPKFNKLGKNNHHAHSQTPRCE